jgi:hypothetical protein
MNQDLEKVKTLAKDLRKTEPSAPDQELAGFPLAARCLDKCRAELVGWQGDYKFNCPMDQEFLRDAELAAEDFKTFVASGADDEEVASWIKENAHART